MPKTSSRFRSRMFRVDRCRPAARGAPKYQRAIDLPGLVAMWPHEIEDTTPAGRLRLLGRLRRALRVERQRGLAGHWTYDLARHRQLLAAYWAEAAELAALALDDRAVEGRCLARKVKFAGLDQK